MSDGIGWVVRDIARRDECETGQYEFFEWRRYCIDHRIGFMFYSLLPGRRAYLIADTIVLQAGMGRFETAWHAWEEIGHWATFVGNREFWRSRPQGEITLRKIERRARAYRAIRPVWRPDELTSFLTDDLSIPENR